jgi:glycosyltransferase involved in cell wall biosynthesis
VDIFGKVGDRSLPGMVRALGLDGFVTMKGPRPHEELVELYGEYDVFAFPTSEREPFGLVPLEAAARGCVPLMTRRCGIAEWLVHGVHCLKAARSPEAFARALHDVARGATPLEPIARRAAEVAWGDFHLDAILPRIETVLADAAQSDRAGFTRKSAVDRRADRGGDGGVKRRRRRGS